MKTRKIPMRSCVVTREKYPKQELIRVVRTCDGSVVVDETGKQNGRGAYLKKDLSVIEKAEKSNILNKHLETVVPKEIFEELKNKEKLKSYIEKLIKNQEINILKEEDYERYKLINTIYEDMKEISPKKILEIYQNVNIDILIQEIKKIELKSIVFFRSTNDKNI